MVVFVCLFVCLFVLRQIARDLLHALSHRHDYTWMAFGEPVVGTSGDKLIAY